MRNAACRLGEVIKEIFKKADVERKTSFLTLLRSWIKQTENPSVVRLALQIYGFYYESKASDETDAAILLDSILSILQTAEHHDSDWEQIYAALQLASILVQNIPDTLFSSKVEELWTMICSCTSYPPCLGQIIRSSTHWHLFPRFRSEQLRIRHQRPPAHWLWRPKTQC